MRKTILVLSKLSGFFPYAYREEIRERGRRLAAFLEFIDSNDNRPDRYWALLTPFLYDEEVSNIEKRDPDRYLRMMGLLDEQRRKALREKLRAGFEDLIHKLAAGAQFTVLKSSLTLTRVSLTGTGEIYYGLPTPIPFFLREPFHASAKRPSRKEITIRITPKMVFDDLQAKCAILLWWCLLWLRPEVIQRCEQCQRYIFRVTAHQVKYCSDACRWQAFVSKRKVTGKVRTKREKN